MKVISLLILFMFLGCQKQGAQEGKARTLVEGKKKIPVNFSIIDFKNWKIDEQVKFINSLDLESKFKFLGKFLPDNIFNSPPTEQLKFLGDGKIIISSIAPQVKGGVEYNHSYWTIKENKLYIWKTSVESPYPKSNEIWTNFLVERSGQGDNSFLSIFFLGDNCKEDLLHHDEHGGPFSGKYYEAYVKSIK